MLVDTSVLVNHIHVENEHLSELFVGAAVSMHPFVFGEIACGSIKDRKRVLGFLRKLPIVQLATDSEVLQFIDRYSLMGKGIGYIDVHLLASAAITAGTRLWSADRHLAGVAERLDLAYHPR